MEQVKFIALDSEDLEVISAHVQDATVRVSDILWRPREQRLVIAIDRFDWMGAEAGQRDVRRFRSALRFERVSALKCRNVDPAARENRLNLLAVEFVPSDPPGGVVHLLFSDDIALRLDVECIEVELADLGPVWTADLRPVHSDIVTKPQG